jgi:hypothetical protein
VLLEKNTVGVLVVILGIMNRRNPGIEDSAGRRAEGAVVPVAWVPAVADEGESSERLRLLVALWSSTKLQQLKGKNMWMPHNMTYIVHKSMLIVERLESSHNGN